MSEETTEAIRDYASDIFHRYQALGVVAKNAGLERDALRPEIEEGMKDGEVFGDTKQLLVFENSVRETFDAVQALNDGDISPEVYKKHLKITPVRKLIARNRTPEKEELQRVKLLLEKQASPLLKLVQAFAKGDTPSPEDVQDIIKRALGQ